MQLKMGICWTQGHYLMQLKLWHFIQSVIMKAWTLLIKDISYTTYIIWTLSNPWSDYIFKFNSKTSSSCCYQHVGYDVCQPQLRSLDHVHCFMSNELNNWQDHEINRYCFGWAGKQSYSVVDYLHLKITWSKLITHIACVTACVEE